MKSVAHCTMQHGRDVLMISRLLWLRRLTVDAPMAAETFVEGLPTLSSLTQLTHLSLYAAGPPPRPRDFLPPSAVSHPIPCCACF